MPRTAYRPIPARLSFTPPASTGTGDANRRPCLPPPEPRLHPPPPLAFLPAYPLLTTHVSGPGCNMQHTRPANAANDPHPAESRDPSTPAGNCPPISRQSRSATEIESWCALPQSPAPPTMCPLRNGTLHRCQIRRTGRDSPAETLFPTDAESTPPSAVRSPHNAIRSAVHARSRRNSTAPGTPAKAQ